MASRLQLETRLIGELRKDPIVFGSTKRMAGCDIDARNCLGGCGDLRSRAHGQRCQLLRVRGLGCQPMRASLDHSRRFLMKLRRIEAHDPSERLAMSEAAVRRHQPVGVLRRDLDMIAEHGVVPDLQRADPGRITVARFECRNRAASVRSGVTERIQRRIVAFRDVAAFRRIDGRRFDQSRAQPVDQRAVAAEERQERVEQARPFELDFKLVA